MADSSLHGQWRMRHVQADATHHLPFPPIRRSTHVAPCCWRRALMLCVLWCWLYGLRWWGTHRAPRSTAWPTMRVCGGRWMAWGLGRLVSLWGGLQMHVQFPRPE